MNNNNSIMCERMTQLRGRRSQGDAARELGITQAYLSEIERGKKTPSYPVLMNIAATYNTSVAYLLGEVESPEPLSPARRSKAASDPEADSASQLIYPHIPVYTARGLVDRLDDGALSASFALLADGEALAAFGIPLGAEVVVDPCAQVEELDVVLVRYRGDLAIVKFRKRLDGSMAMLTRDGVRHCIEEEDLVAGNFTIVGKIISVTYKMKHGL